MELWDDIFCWKTFHNRLSAYYFENHSFDNHIIRDRNTSIRLETTVHALRQYIAKIQDDQARMKEIHGQHVVKMEIFMELITKTIVSHPEMTSERDQNDGTLNPTWNQNTNEPWGANPVATPMNSVHVADIEPQCKCRCHNRSSKRSPQVMDQIIGSLFAGYSGIPCLIPQCNVLSCQRSCPNPDVTVSVTYFFPAWILSQAFTLAFKRSVGGFDYNIRIINCVSYLSLIFQYAYQGDVSRMKSLLKSKLGSPFDVTSNPQRSLLGV